MDLNKLEMAANTGKAGAQALLGLCYLDGVGVETDYRQAFKWLTIASNNGSPRAKANLALMYQQGLGVETDLAEAERLFLQANQKQEFMAVVGLARLYAQHFDAEQACHWYKAVLNAADKNSHEEECREAEAFLSRNP